MAPTQPWRGNREASVEQDYDMYNPNNHSGTNAPAESKRDKRRRDMVDRVGRLYNDTVERRDRVFHDLSEIFARTADELLPPPVFPTYDLSIPVGQLPPSLPFTDPVIPDMHPTPYLFALHRLSLARSNQLLGIRLFHDHQIGVAKRLYDAEVERIEEEYEGATKGVVERLMEGVEERRKKLSEEKEGEGVNLDTFQDLQSRSHGTRRVRGSVPNRSQPSTNGDMTASTSATTLDAHGNSIPPHSSTGLASSTSGAYDPFHFGSSLLPNPTSALLSLSGAGPTAALLTHSTATTTKRKPGVRPQPGLPPSHFLVTSGAYNQFGKSLAGISGLRGDEIDGDLGEVRRKRVRTGHHRR